MNNLTTIIIDDEPRAVNVLSHILAHYCPKIEIVGKAIDSTTGLNLIKELKPQILFLDVEMPHMNGFDILNNLGNPEIFTIFTTAYSQYAIQAIRHNAIDYLLKPIDPKELIAVISKIEGIIAEKTHDLKISKEIIDYYKFSKREIEIINISFQLKSSQEISNYLFLSNFTVNRHFQNIYKKMDINSRFEMEKKFKAHRHYTNN